MIEPTRLEFLKIQDDRPDVIALLMLNRPETSNAFDDAMIRSIREDLAVVREHVDSCRALVIRGKGKNFCAGADLGWMRRSMALSSEKNLTEAKDMASMFEELYRLPVPSIALVKGAVYGGGVGLVACTDIAIAAEEATFCLKEVKIGLIPSVILPYLMRRMKTGQLRRHALSGRVFSAMEAKDFGLVEVVAAFEGLNLSLREELTHILAGSPEAQRSLKTLLGEVQDRGGSQGDYTAEAIGRARASSAGQSGMSSFFQKITPPWFLTDWDDWRTLEEWGRE